MEKLNKHEPDKTNDGATENIKKESLVETKKQEAFDQMCNELDTRLSRDINRVFEVNGREYELTCAEDCMVAYAQQMRRQVEELHKEVIQKDDYYEEKATAKLLELFKAYERLVSLFAELQSYYPVAAARVGERIPSLTECSHHATKMWEDTKKQTN